MRRWALRLLAGVMLAVCVVFLLAWLTLRASLPAIDGEVVVAGLGSSAVIERDATGIPTILAANRQDLAFATGFVHGQDRYFQMDTIRRKAAGELAEIFGSAAVAQDKRYRLHRFRSRARDVLALLHASERRLLERYAAGVNAGLDSLGAAPFEYYLLATDPQPWLAEDSVLVLYTMFLQLNDARAMRDIRRGLVHRVLPAEVYAWLYPQGTSWDAPLMGTARPPMPLPSADTYSLRGVRDDAPPADERDKEPLFGSNNWAVSGTLTGSGRAIVANDMHLGHSAPNIYYRARLVMTEGRSREVTGVTLPGSPFVVAGSNGKVAWGYTNSYGDWADAVLLRPGAAPDSYRTPDGDAAFAVYRELIEVRDAEPVVLRVRDTVWGPVLDDIDYPDGEIAVSWIAHAPEAVNLKIVDMETVDSVYAAMDVANTMGIPPQNFVVGDTDGNIAWTIAGKIPRKSGFNAMLPADWSESPGWTGWLDPADYPRIVNPDNGRIWTANARVTDGAALQIVGDGGYDLGARAQQIRDSLLARDRFEPADMLAIQYDDRALFLSRWQQLLLDVLDANAVAADPSVADYRRLVDNWIPRATPESVGYRLVRAFRLEVQARVFHALMGPVRDAYGDDVTLRLSNQFEGPLWQLLSERPQHLLPGGYASWRELLLEAVRENIRYFAARYDGSLEQRTWGERNMAEIRHPLSRALPFLSQYLDMPRDPLNGDINLPKAQGPDFGASERFAVAPGNEANGLMHMPTGQSGHPLSPFYRRGHDDWVRGRPSPFLPGTTQHKLTLQAAGQEY
ncbi:MAG: penicillin acylase family protein [Gammaproteobacteria bacterium]|nr:penicillin acylase family protein [Gammaproteobacteria bacterium]